MSSRKLVTWQQTGSAAGGADRYLRATDWYNTSETRINRIFEPETHMCYISTRDDLRDRIFIAPSPDPDAVFSKKLTEPLVGPSLLGTGAAQSAALYTCEPMVFLFLDKTKMPLVIESFAADRKSATCASSIIGNYVDAGFKAPVPAAEGGGGTIAKHAKCDDSDDNDEPRFVMPAIDRHGNAIVGADGVQETMTVVYYPCTFIRVALSPNCYGSTIGALSVYTSGRRDRASGVLTAFFPKNYLGQYPKQTYLRMQIRVMEGDREKWLDYIPLDPIKGSDTESATDEYGIVRYLIDDLALGTKYVAWVVDITANPNDSSTIRDRKRNLKTLTFDTVYFQSLRAYNPGNISANCESSAATPQLNLADTSLPVSAELAASRASQSIYYWQATTLDQPIHKTTFDTPFAASDKRQPISFIAGSCFAGTLDALEGAHKLGVNFNVLLGDKSYNDNSRGTVSDFIANYMGWLRNDNGQRTLVSSALYTVTDDHENADNWFRNIAISRFNTARYFLDNGAYFGPENDLYKLIAGIPSTAAKIPFRLTNQYAATLSTSERVKNAFEANSRFWPTAPFKANATDISPNGSFAVQWGNMLAIVLNSNTDVNGDGSVPYNAVEGTLSADGTSFVRPPVESYNYLPPESLNFLKRVLREKKAGCYSVFFSSDVSCMFRNYYTFLRADFVQTATAAIRSTDPDAPIPYELISSLYEKLFNAFNYDSPDGYHKEIGDLVAWIKQRNIHNVFFYTGDPHSTLVRYLDKDNVIVSACLSAVSTYRASGANLTLASNLESDSTIISLSNNAYGHMEYDPVKGTVDIKLRYGEEIRARASIPLNGYGGWFGS